MTEEHYLWVSVEELIARCKTQEEYDQTIYILKELLGE